MCKLILLQASYVFPGRLESVFRRDQELCDIRGFLVSLNNYRDPGSYDICLMNLLTELSSG
jgi:hypothetical protein